MSVSMKPGATAVDGDISAGHLLRQRLGEGDEAGLRRGIVLPVRRCQDSPTTELILIMRPIALSSCLAGLVG